MSFKICGKLSSILNCSSQSGLQGVSRLLLLNSHIFTSFLRRSHTASLTSLHHAAGNTILPLHCSGATHLSCLNELTQRELIRSLPSFLTCNARPVISWLFTRARQCQLLWQAMRSENLRLCFITRSHAFVLLSFIYSFSTCIQKCCFRSQNFYSLSLFWAKHFPSCSNITY